MQVGLHDLSSTEATYRSLLGKLMQQQSKPLVDAYAAVEDLLGGVQSYVNVRTVYSVRMYVYVQCVLMTRTKKCPDTA